MGMEPLLIFFRPGWKEKHQIADVRRESARGEESPPKKEGGGDGPYSAFHATSF